MNDLRARALLAARERGDQESAIPREPTELEEMAASVLSRVTATTVDPLVVRESHHRPGHTRYETRCRIEGVEFKTWSTWGGGDSRYSNTNVQVRVGHLWWKHWVEVRNLADLGEALGR